MPMPQEPNKKRPLRPRTLLEKTDALRVSHAFVLDGYSDAARRVADFAPAPGERAGDTRWRVAHAVADALSWTYVFSEADEAGVMAPKGAWAVLRRRRRRLVAALCCARHAFVHGQHLPIRWLAETAEAVWVDELPPSEKRTEADSAVYRAELSGKSVAATLVRVTRTLRAASRRRRRHDDLADTAYRYVMRTLHPKL